MARLALTACLFLFFGCVSAGGLTARERNQRSTFLLTNPGRGQCSGVVITTDGYILTAAHCLDQNTEYLEVHITEDGPLVNARVIAYNRDRDLALLKADHSFGSAARLHAGRTLAAGDTIYHVGHPFGGRHGLPQLFGVGHIMNPDAELSELVGTHWIFVDLETGRPGASGSGAYDANSGGLIGMVDAVVTVTAPGFDAMSVVLLVPYPYIQEFLRQNGVNIPTVEPSSSGWDANAVRPHVRFVSTPADEYDISDVRGQNVEGE